MKWILFLLLFATVLVAAAGLLPFAGTDVAKLHPVEVIAVSMNEEQLLVRTDTNATGRGESIHAAFTNLKDTASGEVFLETANYLLLREDCTQYILELSKLLRPACQVCIYLGDGDLKSAAKFLDSHPTGVTVLDCIKENPQLPRLLIEGKVFSYAK